LKKEILFRNIRFLKSLKRSFQFSLSSWSESRYLYQFEEADHLGIFFDNKIKSTEILESAPYPIMVSSGLGLSIIKGNKIHNLLSTPPGFYVFGVASSNKRIYITINFHMPIKSNINNLIKKRITLLVSAKISDIIAAIKNNQYLVNWHTHLIDRNKSYSYLNYYDSSLYAADYLGSIDVFKIDEKNNESFRKIKSLDLLKSNLHYPNYFYPYLHMNCVSVDERNIYCGLHAYSKITKYKSSLYRIEKSSGSIALERDTNFVSAHDLMKVNDDFYGCDSDNGKLFRNNDCIFQSNQKSFFRGLSINKNGFVLGSSIYSKRRSQREKPNSNNKILFLDKDGSLLSTLTPNFSSIYRIFSLGKTELSQSSSVNIMRNI
tara:strand:+ start:852 stop:1979 length:1128 start_codon:yes stop_codon:yes gene_type:complete